MTINRRVLLAGLTAAAAVSASRLTSAQSWRGQYPELVYAVVPAENATGVTDRYTPFVEYLGRELDTNVTLRVANDYAAVIEGQRAGNIHIGYYGPASLSRERLADVPADAFVIDINSDAARATIPYSTSWPKAPIRKSRI
jgi:phosphonate transport system substrate-binding protein